MCTHIFGIGRFGLCSTTAGPRYVCKYMPLLSDETCVKILCGHSMQVSGFLRFAVRAVSLRPRGRTEQQQQQQK